MLHEPLNTQFHLWFSTIITTVYNLYNYMSDFYTMHRQGYRGSYQGKSI